ncbi:hypothetical protein F0562_032666 [Nyssa sinensis]|uniref:DUF4220 domain-containing protein n=1 Tax=Nyssa sinensis TaxID=561372 RepID=A0A5J5AQM8_9ASTE|nr:hypothetical protein F0562_032666 [Nyssa sinensis]
MSCRGWDFAQTTAPMPWVGVYIAAASLVCSLAMAADVFWAFRHKRLGFPCKFFTLNATTLTLLAVAMKLPVDLATPMRGRTDQFAKLAGTVFMSTAMGNFMPSLGSIDDKEIFMNITALGILIITLVVNVYIQLGTGAIYCDLVAEQTAVTFLMLLVFVILSFSAITVPATKRYLEQKYSEIHKIASGEDLKETGNLTVQKLKEDVRKYWMMAETSNPQFVVARSVTCSASGAICFLTALILVEAVLRMFLMFPRPFSNLGAFSEYKWSTFFIFVIQSIGVGVGTIAIAFRWFTAIKLKCSEKRGKSYKTEFKTEAYWIERLVEWKESAFTLQIRHQKFRKLVHKMKNLILDFCIRVQIGIVVMSKSVQFFSIFFISWFLTCCHYCMGFRKKSTSTASDNGRKLESPSESKHSPRQDISFYVLHLEGEEELPLQITKNNSDATDRLIQMGREKQPIYLKGLLEKSIGFKEVARFDNDQVPSLDSEEHPNSWTLPVVTLTSIAIALPNIENHMVDHLVHSVSEGLLYVSTVERMLDNRALKDVKNAADIVWLGVDLFGKWLGEDLRRMATEGKTSKETLEKLADIATENVMECKIKMKGAQKKNWLIKQVASNSMYRISKTILLDYEDCNDLTDERLFDRLSVMISDILGACLTNLPRVIIMKLFCSAIEKKGRECPTCS